MLFLFFTPYFLFPRLAHLGFSSVLSHEHILLWHLSSHTSFPICYFPVLPLMFSGALLYFFHPPYFFYYLCFLFPVISPRLSFSPSPHNFIWLPHHTCIPLCYLQHVSLCNSLLFHASLLPVLSSHVHLSADIIICIRAGMRHEEFFSCSRCTHGLFAIRTRICWTSLWIVTHCIF